MKILIFEKFDESYLREEEWLVALSPVSCDLDDIAIADKKSEEEIHAFLDKNKATIQQNQIVLVSLFNLSLGLQIVHHIRLTEEYKRLPILLFGNIEETEIHKQQNDLSHICHTKGTRYFLEDDLTQQRLLSTVEELNKELNELLKDDDTFRDGFLKKIIIREPDKTGRHSIANQWGAYRMAQVAGLDIAKFNYPKTLYFKYLLAQSKEPEPIPVDFPIVKKILFVDDNYQKGWKDCLEGLFGEGTIEAYESWQKAQEAGANTRIESNEYDLVFLDFYLGEGDIIGKGKDALDTIKGLNSVLPVIMFTASNKAWNMHELHQAGADGYFVKEHPETAKDPDFSVKNFENFQQTVTQCVKKGELLRKFWKQKKLINKSNLLVNKPNQINRERILERLIMFIGLLKKAKEQTKFDTTTFFYSDWELAFLTLWSTLNEIQEVYFNKQESTFNIKGYPGNWTPFQISGNSIKYISKWVIMGQSNDIYFEKVNISIKLNPNGGFLIKNGELVYDSDTNCFLSFNKNNSPFYSTRDTFGNYQKAKTFQPDQKLSFQIAFLILEKQELKNSPKKSEYLKNLKELNEFRNHLYLTHGEDADNADFSNLYIEQRKLDSDQTKSDEKWQKKINQLFEIVYFLCTGNECAW